MREHLTLPDAPHNAGRGGDQLLAWSVLAAPPGLQWSLPTALGPLLLGALSKPLPLFGLPFLHLQKRDGKFQHPTCTQSCVESSEACRLPGTAGSGSGPHLSQASSSLPSCLHELLQQLRFWENKGREELMPASSNPRVKGEQRLGSLWELREKRQKECRQVI